MDDPRRYIQMMNLIRARIEDGSYKPNELMPSIQELSEQTGFSRHTIGKAMRMLQEQGLVQRTPGLGYCPTARATSTNSRSTALTRANGNSVSTMWGRAGERA
jgi:DNA-binding GntR family transcriptional regulator